MKRKIKYFAIFSLLVFGMVILNAYKPIRNFITQPSPWTGTSVARSKLPQYDPAKKTVFIIADDKLTEVFDMLAPFYLFNATEKANVYILAKEKTPILVRSNLFVCPQLTFSEADSMKLHADVMVIPALSKRDEHQDSAVIGWIKRHFTTGTKMLTICDGAATGAATGLYDGKPITCHATDFEDIKNHFDRPVWVQQVPVAKDGNLFSTGGVSNAVEGSLSVIGELFGAETTKKAAAGINYPHEEPRRAHKSIAVNGGNILSLATKVFFKNNRNIGILFENGTNEFIMATVLDTYSRTFPASFRIYILHDSAIQTKYGLTIIYKGYNDPKNLDELHLAIPGILSAEDARLFGSIETVPYNDLQKQYLFNVCLQRIARQYGDQFERFVKISMDYN